jgi:hypothetical protein
MSGGGGWTFPGNDKMSIVLCDRSTYFYGLALKNFSEYYRVYQNLHMLHCKNREIEREIWIYNLYAF